MICSHFFRSRAKLLLWVWSIFSRARSPSAIIAQHGELLHPFCGAEISTSTLHFFMSIHIAPEAMQSRTNIPLTDSCLLYHISEPTRRTPISYAVFCLKK